MKAILPEESQEEIPVGFSIVGHVGKYLRYIIIKSLGLILFSTSKSSRAVSTL
jgi:hypothetical protein